MEDVEVTEAPEIHCPKCDHDWTDDEFLLDDVNEGSRTECPKCRAELECCTVETVTNWSWKVTEEER